MDRLPHEKQIFDYEKALRDLKDKNQNNILFSEKEMQQLEKKLDKVKERVYKDLSSWERIQICRHPNRPKSLDLIKNICSDFEELFGDRTFGDDSAVVGGLGEIGSQKFIVVGQEKGNDTETRIHRNFGMLMPEGFRKALRLAQLADKFCLPIVFIIDTPGAFPGLVAEERGQGWAISKNIMELFRITTPIIILIAGEGCSGGALGMAIGDSIGMLEHAYYSVISPEGCASILWKDSSKNYEAASKLKINSENMKDFGIIDEILKEPLGGAHYDPEEVYETVENFILSEWNRLKLLSKEELLESRYNKFRNIGSYEISVESST